MIKTVVVDDDKLVSLSLKTILESGGEISVAEIGSSGSEAIDLYEKHAPDVMLMDIRMNGMTGIEAGEKILSAHPDARILYLTTFSDDEYIVKALNMGAKGYILKQDFEGIAPAVSAVMRGQRVFGDEIMTRLPELMQKKAEFDFAAHDISEKEQEIMVLVARGLSNKEIAAQLFLSEGTVRNYISGILDKLSLRDRTQLAVFYYTKCK
ncbi:MAG: response regulator transcription factor [Alistipes sp.]|nr:response regulator transcription factor [Alistipes sp.]